MNQPKTKRNYFSFSLRTLLIFMLLLACLFCWVGIRYRRAQQQRAVLDRIEASTGDAYIGNDPANPTDWELFFDSNYLHRIDNVSHFNLPFSDLKPLAELKNLQTLDLWTTEVSDIGPLAQLKNLNDLNLSYNPITDLSPLAELNNLEKLYIHSTQVTDLVPLAGLKNLQLLNLVDTKVTDLSPLAQLNKLEHLDLRNTKIEKQHVENLQKSLPNCKIFY